jgi:hypothetical protein
MCHCANLRFRNKLLTADPPPHFTQALRYQLEVLERGSWDRLLMLSGDCEQPSDAVHVLSGE